VQHESVIAISRTLCHIGHDVVVHYRWHPLYGRSVRRIQGVRRASGDVVHVELSPGAVTILPARKLGSVYCAGLKVGPPQASLAGLLHELLIACESRLVSADGNIVRQETQDGSAVTARTEDRARSEAEQPPGGPTSAQPHSRRHAIRGMTPVERQAVLRALARLLLEASGVAKPEVSDDNA
jgi:hypothetical protein